MTEVPDVVDAIGVQSNIAIILSAFAFSALVLLFNNFGAAHTPDSPPVTIRVGSIEGRAVVLMLAAFNVGIASAYMFSLSLGGDASPGADVIAYRGFVVAQVAFGLQVLALISPVLLLIDRYLRYPGPLVSWSLLPVLLIYGGVRIGSELDRGWQLEGGSGSTGWVIFAAAVVPSVIALPIYTLRAFDRLPERFRRLDNFLLHNSLGYMMMLAFAIVAIGVIHFQATSGGGQIRSWQFPGLSLLLGTTATWTAIHTWPDPTGYSPKLEPDGSNGWAIQIEDFPILTALLNEWLQGQTSSERADQLTNLVTETSEVLQRIDRRPVGASGQRILAGDFGELYVLNNGYLNACTPAGTQPLVCEQYEADELLRAMRRWAKRESSLTGAKSPKVISS